MKELVNLSLQSFAVQGRASPPTRVLRAPVATTPREISKDIREYIIDGQEHYPLMLCNAVQGEELEPI